MDVITLRVITAWNTAVFRPICGIVISNIAEHIIDDVHLEGYVMACRACHVVNRYLTLEQKVYTT